MKKPSLFFVIAILLTGCMASVRITSSESDAKIYVNGNYTATGNYRVQIKPKECQTVRIEKIAYLSDERKYCYNVQGFQTPPSRDYVTLHRDESYDASVKSDIANNDFSIEVNKKYKEDDAWKIISQVVSGYFDELVTNSKETGWLTTTWKVQIFPQRTIRTKIVVKQSNSIPLTYKVKVVSEIATQGDVSAKDDEKFKEWERVLKKYENVIGEFQTRLGNK